jgi:hypothetical protein
MSNTPNRTDFVTVVAREVSSGIDRALTYWLGRIEVEVVDQSLTVSDRMAAIQSILQEYKHLRSGEVGCAA